MERNRLRITVRPDRVALTATTPDGVVGFGRGRPVSLAVSLSICNSTRGGHAPIAGSRRPDGAPGRARGRARAAAEPVRVAGAGI